MTSFDAWEALRAWEERDSRINLVTLTETLVINYQNVLARRWIAVYLTR
jgi:hypothetical protein